MFIYLFNIKSIKSSDEFISFLPLISMSKKKLLNYKYIDDKLRSMYGELLLLYALKVHFNKTHTDIIIDLNTYGKPYITNLSGIYFNISHSDEWVICAIHTKELGADIEKINNIDESIFEHILSKEENKYIFNKLNKQEIFFEYWCVKESYYKFVGKGIDSDMCMIDVNLKDSNNIKLSKYGQKQNLYFQLYNELNDYKIVVCTSDKFDAKYIYINSIDLKNILL